MPAVAPPAPAIDLDEKTACALPPTVAGAISDGAAPFRRPDGLCDDWDCDWAQRPPDPADTCFVAESNLARAEADSRASVPGRVASTPWDRRSAPTYLDRVAGHLHLGDAERALLRDNGFVVLDRLGYGSYAVAFHDVFQQQLPVYVSVDAVMNAVFQASQMLLGSIERRELLPRLVKMLDRLDRALGSARASYGEELANDLEVYLSVARRLLHGHRDLPPSPREAVEGVVSGLTEQARFASGLQEVALFGRDRMIDFSSFQPRGHYALRATQEWVDVDGDSFELPDYFRAMAWLSRLELNLVSRSSRSSQPGAVADPRETPREARVALALADLVSRARALDDLRRFEAVYTVFAGGREDVSVFDLLRLTKAAGIRLADPEAPDRLRKAIGTGFRRTARTHWMPQGTPDLPVIATLLGPRIVPDIAPLTELVHDAIPGRTLAGPGDMAYLLGHDRGAHYIADLHDTAGLSSALDRGRAVLASSAAAGKDVYSAWLSATLRIADVPVGTVPSFMQSDAYADLRMSSALAAYGQLRHAFVLLAGQGYDAYGCEIPDGWVEPAVGVYDALRRWARTARAVAPDRGAYFDRFEAVLGMLRDIAATELSGAALSEPQRRWLGMVAEHVPIGAYYDTGQPPKWTGWYFDLFPDREDGAERAVDFVADYLTLTNAGVVQHLGVEKAALGVFVVDTGGAPRVMVGPVAKTYAVSHPVDAPRLDDEAAREVAGKAAPWGGYIAPSPPEPPLRAQFFACERDVRVLVRAARSLGRVQVTMLDHHGDALGAPLAHEVGTDHTTFVFALPAALLTGARLVEGVHVRVDDLAVSGAGQGRFDVVAGGTVYQLHDRYPRRHATRGLDLELGEPAMWERP